MTPQAAFIRFVFNLAFACLLFSGCSRSTESKTSSPTESTVRIAVVPRGADDPVFPFMKVCIERENRRPDAEGVVFEPCVPDWSDASSQADLLRSLRENGYRGVVVFPADAAICKPALETLARSGAVIVTLGVNLESDLLNLYSAEDSGQIGSRVAELAAEASKEKGTIGLLHLGEGHPLTQRRLQAFESSLRNFAWAEVLVRVDVSGNPLEARQRFNEALTRYPRTKLWVSLSGWPIQLQDRTPLATVPADVVMVTTDPSPYQWPGIRDGRIVASVGVDYQQMVERAVRMCASLCKGETIQVQRHTLPAETVDQGNLDDWIVRWSQ